MYHIDNLNHVLELINLKVEIVNETLIDYLKNDFPLDIIRELKLSNYHLKRLRAIIPKVLNKDSKLLYYFLRPIYSSLNFGKLQNIKFGDRVVTIGGKLINNSISYMMIYFSTDFNALAMLTDLILSEFSIETFIENSKFIQYFDSSVINKISKQVSLKICDQCSYLRGFSSQQCEHQYCDKSANSLVHVTG